MDSRLYGFGMGWAVAVRLLNNAEQPWFAQLRRLLHDSVVYHWLIFHGCIRQLFAPRAEHRFSGQSRVGYPLN
jgi:hypothetical protein